MEPSNFNTIPIKKTDCGITIISRSLCIVIIGLTISIVRSGRVWKPETELEEARRDLVCESVRGMVQPQKRVGIGFGDWKKTLGEDG